MAANQSGHVAQIVSAVRFCDPRSLFTPPKATVSSVLVSASASRRFSSVFLPLPLPSPTPSRGPAPAPLPPPSPPSLPLSPSLPMCRRDGRAPAPPPHSATRWPDDGAPGLRCAAAHAALRPPSLAPPQPQRASPVAAGAGASYAACSCRFASPPPVPHETLATFLHLFAMVLEDEGCAYSSSGNLEGATPMPSLCSMTGMTLTTE